MNKKWEGFDYVKFLSEVMDLGVVQKDEWSGRLVSSILEKLEDPESVPLLRQLLTHPTYEVRFNAVLALSKIYHEPKLLKAEPNSYYDFRSHEKEYLPYWENKLKEIEVTETFPEKRKE